jgi:mannose-6-phosphate isomerase
VKNKPFLLKPAGKDYLWGGTRLRDDFSKDIDITPFAEAWECSTHPDGPSIVSSGEYRGKKLIDVLKQHPEYLGTHPFSSSGGIPILIKFIDAKQNLSVQVHPSDDYAMTNENGQFGKTEMWYVVDALPGAQLIYGFHRDISKDQLREYTENGSIEKYLNKVEIKKNDVFYITPGTVHAIGAGALIVEIQESSNLTYRLYDYNRVDKNGKKRQLHIDKAIQVSNLHASDVPRQPMRVLRYKPGYASELLRRCKYFQVERLIINTERLRSMYRFHTGSNSFEVLVCVDGCGELLDEESNTRLDFFKGDTIFIPANSVGLKIHGKAQFLKVNC